MHIDLKKITSLGRNSNIEMHGNKELIADGCKSVCDYGTDFIRLDFGIFEMKIRGDALVIDSYVYEQIDITGTIISVEFAGGI